MRFNVVCFGALNMDKLHRVNRIAREDEESFIIDLKERPGGSAANTAVGLARLGLRVGFIGKVAEDREGRLLLKDFRDEEVDTTGVVVSKQGRSGGVMGYVDRKGERALYVDPGVNDSLESGEINLEYAKNTEFLHLTSFVADTPFHAQKDSLENLPDVKVSFDPGELYARRGLDSLKPLIRRSYVMFPNEHEVRLLTGRSYKKGSEVLLNEGARIVVATLGRRGCYITNGGENHLVEPSEVEVVDTTGAGDAFCAGFLYGLIKGRGLRDCGRMGNLVASCCLREVGAREGLPKISTLEKHRQLQY
ncbi:MAG: carbohydrate kinase family protein [Candidatus Bathyarchaeota archaeon]|nr:MAG: carbohydrate kinase family protein [Candidatus Bathyarchaeota archaeon]